MPVPKVLALSERKLCWLMFEFDSEIIFPVPLTITLPTIPKIYTHSHKHISIKDSWYITFFSIGYSLVLSNYKITFHNLTMDDVCFKECKTLKTLITEVINFRDYKQSKIKSCVFLDSLVSNDLVCWVIERFEANLILNYTRKSLKQTKKKKKL